GHALPPLPGRRQPPPRRVGSARGRRHRARRHGTLPRPAGRSRRIRRRSPRPGRSPGRPLMDPFGTTRSPVRSPQALTAPDSFVPSDLPGWEGTRGVILISPRMGARFTQSLALMEPNGSAGPPPPGVERVLYGLEGEATIALTDGPGGILCPGGFAYWPPGA